MQARHAKSPKVYIRGGLRKTELSDVARFISETGLRHLARHNAFACALLRREDRSQTKLGTIC